MKRPSMAEYARGDFHAYYGGALILHPTDAKPCRVIGDNPDGTCATADVLGNHMSPIRYESLTFEHFKSYPPLGYRHIDNGEFLYFLSRRAQRQRGKGLRDNTLLVQRVPELTQLCRVAGLDTEFRRNQGFTPKIAQAIFFPDYKTVDEAVAMLKKGDKTLGIALSNAMAITLLISEKTPFVLLFKGDRIAHSQDGEVWRPTHEEYYTLLSRSLPNLKLENA